MTRKRVEIEYTGSIAKVGTQRKEFPWEFWGILACVAFFSSKIWPAAHFFHNFFSKPKELLNNSLRRVIAMS